MDRCQFNAIKMVKVPRSRKLRAAIDPEKCYGCGVCVVKYPTQGPDLEGGQAGGAYPRASRVGGNDSAGCSLSSGWDLETSAVERTGKDSPALNFRRLRGRLWGLSKDLLMLIRKKIKLWIEIYRRRVK